MPTVFNPKQGGFQSVAPKNPIEKAIDKNQANQSKPQIPVQTPQRQSTKTHGGTSTRNPITGSGEYNLGEGVTVPITPGTTKAVQEGRSRTEVILAAAKDNASLGAAGTSGGNVGALIVSEQEAQAFQQKGGGYVPYYVTQAKTPQQAAIEGSVLGQTSFTPQGGFFNPVTTRSQFEVNEATRLRTQDIAKDIFTFQESPSTFKGAVGTSTSEGTSYQLSEDYFNKKFFSNESNLGYTKQARTSFESLPQETRTKMQVAQEVTAFTRAGVGAVEFGGSLLLTGKDIIKNQGFGLVTQEMAKNSQFALPTWKSYELPGTQSLKQVPSIPSIYVTKDIPIITKFTGVGVPTRAQDIIPYAREVGQNPEKVINIASISYVGGAGAKGLLAGREIFIAERAAGASRLGALNTVGGEFVSSLSPIQVRQRIFVSETPLRPFKTTQLNKGDILTTTKIGEANGQQLFTAGEKGMTSYTPKQIDYLIYKPKLTGAEFTKGSLTVSEVQVTTLGKNVFAAKQTSLGYDISGQGTRYVDIIGERLVQTGRYSLGKEPYFGRYTQEFKSFGQGKQVSPFGKEIDITVTKSKFKTVEFKQYANGKYTTGGKAFGKGIVGRPQTAKSIDIYTKTGRIENEFGAIDFGKSFGKSMSGGRKMVSSFNVRTITPKKNFIDIKSFGQGKQLPAGFKVTRVYAKGEFNYLADTTKPLQQININRGLSTTLKGSTSPMKTTFETGLKTELKTSNISPRSRTEVIQKQYTESIPKYATTSILSSSSRTGLYQPSVYGLNNKVITSNLTSQATKQSQIVSSASISEFKIPSSNITSPPRGGFNGFNFGTSFTPIGFILPSFALPDYTPGERRTRSQKKRRQVSLYSAVLGVKTSKASPLDITGITQRDIITGKRRKR